MVPENADDADILRVLRAKLDRRDTRALVLSSNATELSKKNAALCERNDALSLENAELRERCGALQVDKLRLQDETRDMHREQRDLEDLLAAERDAREALEEKAERLQARIDETPARERALVLGAVTTLCRKRHARMTADQATEAAEAGARPRLLLPAGEPQAPMARLKALEKENANLSSWLELLADRQLDGGS